MKTINGRNLFAILGLALLSACSSSTGPVNTTVSTAPQLFSLEPTQDRKTLQQTAQGYLATLLADPANAEVTFIKIDPALVSQQTQDLAVTLPDGKTAQFHLRKYNTITPGIDGWVGYKPSVWKQTHASSPSEIDNDPFFYISLARSGEIIVGSVVVEGQTYRVQSVSPGQYVLIKIDESKLPPDGEPVQSAKSVAPDLPTATGSHSAISVIRLLFVTTNQVRDKRPNNRLELANAVNDVNNLMESSDVAIRVDLAGFYDANYDESSGNYWQQGTRLMSNQQVMQRRDALRADLVSIFSTKPELCGQASLNAGKSNAFSIISCTGALGHEIGHNLGAMHHNGESGVPVYAYGYKDEVGNFHTPMRNPHGAVKYFANPRLSYQGRPLGTVDKNDVARRFNERRETVENFYPPVYTPVTLTLYEYDFRMGRSCSMTLENLDVKGPCLQARSARVQGAAAGSKLCIGNSQATNESCYTVVTYNDDYNVSNLDNPQNLPASLRHLKVGAGAIGNTNQVRYQRF